VNLLSLPLFVPPLPLIQLHNPVPPPILTGAPLFLPAVRYLSQPHLLPDIAQNGLVGFVTSPGNGMDVSYVGVGRVVADGGMKGAWERRRLNIRDGKEVDEGRFCEILCIIDDQ
jgi:translation initiation factor 2D